MGTRSRTQVLDEKDRIIVSMYRQFDGYPSGHGAELMEFLLSGTMVNGISGDGRKIFNGTGDMAAKMVEHFKNGQDGGIYLFAPETRGELAEDIFIEYLYTVQWLGTTNNRSFDDPVGGWYVEVDDIHGNTFFRGTPDIFLERLKSGELLKDEEEAYGKDSP